MEEFVVSLIGMLSAKYPWLMTVVSIMGILRLVFKPTFAILRAVAEKTESKSDDAALDTVERSPVFKAVLFALDWFASVKVPKKTVEPTPQVTPVGFIDGKQEEQHKKAM